MPPKAKGEAKAKAKAGLRRGVLRRPARLRRPAAEQEGNSWGRGLVCHQAPRRDGQAPRDAIRLPVFEERNDKKEKKKRAKSKERDLLDGRHPLKAAQKSPQDLFSLDQAEKVRRKKSKKSHSSSSSGSSSSGSIPTRTWDGRDLYGG